ncbi:MAG: siroheme synthase, N-terminal domain [Herbinix sp.]|jgi:siroheme synthase-like protein|nr:siroheme synthase, N-terminal domain [Herbinix sp.]
MAYFPFYIEITNKICVVIGGGRIAHRKIEILAEFGTIIIVIAPRICEDIYMLQKTYAEKDIDGKQHIILRNREFIDEDILEADFVVAATDNAVLNSHISTLCKINNKLVNVVDVKEECSFIFPSIIKKEDLVVAISTGGNNPSIAAKMKQDIEAIIPDYYEALIELLGQYREYIKNEVHTPENRKQIYQELIHLAEVKKGNITTKEIHSVVKKYK